MSKKLKNIKREIIKLRQQLEKKSINNDEHIEYIIGFPELPENQKEKLQENVPILKGTENDIILKETGKSLIATTKDTLSYRFDFQDKDFDTHVLIEADNYDALRILNQTHKGKIDVIYIDPPYNTGNRDFMYNDNFVDKDDPFRHTKWLDFMEKRLDLAKYLLKDTGVIFISIDDHEFAHLRLLCDKRFGEENIEVMIWRKSGIGRDGKMKNTTTFRNDHEYIITCFKNKKINTFGKINVEPNFQNKYGNPDNDPRGNYKAGSVSRKESESNPKHSNYYTVITPTGKKITRQFSVSLNEFKLLESDNRIYWGKKGDAIPAQKIFINEKRLILPSSILDDVGGTSDGKRQFEEILGTVKFNNPKPILLIKRLLDIINNKNAIVLDFFAGSGTTGQAVLELNKEDGGYRTFILVQNNENNICTDICYPRLKKVIEGYTNLKGEYISGIPANLKYYEIDFVDFTKNKSQMAYNFKGKLNDTIAFVENITGSFFDEYVNEKIIYSYYEDDKRFIAIIYNERFGEQVVKMGNGKQITVYSKFPDEYKNFDVKTKKLEIV